MADIIQLRRDTKANWATKNPVLAIGETGLEIDTRKVKYGDGTTTWNDLPYSGGADYGSYDVSEANNGAVYATLQNALTALPVTERKGGMNIRFIDATTNSYVEYRYMAVSTDDSIFLSTGNWQGIDETPTEGSNNLVKSGSIYSELKRQDEAIERLNGNDVVVVEDHTDVENPDPQKIYREQGTDSYTDWMYVDGEWKIISIYTFPGIDNYPAEDSDNLVKSKGIHKAISDAKNDVIGNASDSYNTLGKIEDRIKENEEERDEQIENLIDGATDDYDTLGKIEERVKEESSNRDAAIEELKGGASQYGDTLKKLEERIDTETYERIDQIAESEGNLIDGASDDSNTLKKLEIKINSETSRAKSVEDTKANKATTLAGYGITDGYTKNEGEVFENYVNRTIAVQQAKIDSINGNEVIVVANHSSVSSPKTNTIYREQGTDSYTDWMYAEGVGWKKIATYDFPGMDNVPTSGSQKLLSSDTILTHGNAIDVSILNANVNTNPATPSTYNSLSEALAAVPATSRKGGMSIKFIQTTPAKYTVIKTEGATERPTGTELQSDPGIISGTYTAGELSSFSTLPATLNSSLTYYLTVIETVDEQEVTTYTTWVITYVQSSDNAYVQYRYMGTAVTGNPNPFLMLDNWQGIDDKIQATHNLVENSSIYSILGGECKIIVNNTSSPHSSLNDQFIVNIKEGETFQVKGESGTGTISYISIFLYYTDGTSYNVIKDIDVYHSFTAAKDIRAIGFYYSLSQVGTVNHYLKIKSINEKIEGLNSRVDSADSSITKVDANAQRLDNISYNVINFDTVIQKYCINSNGRQSYNGERACTDYIPCHNEGWISWTASLSGVYVAFYDYNKVYIPNSSVECTAKTAQIPDTAYWVRLSLSIYGTTKNFATFEHRTDLTADAELAAHQLRGDILREIIDTAKESDYNIAYKDYTTNIIDNASLIAGRKVSDTGTTPAADNRCTDFIPCYGQKNVSWSYNAANTYVAFYDINKAYIANSSVVTTAKTAQVPENAYYVRFTCSNYNNRNQAIFGIDATLTNSDPVLPYTPGREVFGKLRIDNWNEAYNKVKENIVGDGTTAFYNKEKLAVLSGQKWRADAYSHYNNNAFLTMLVTTDIHTLWTNLYRAWDFGDNTEEIDFHVCLGDLGDLARDLYNYDWKIQVLARTKPILTIPGNHEMQQLVGTPATEFNGFTDATLYEKLYDADLVSHNGETHDSGKLYWYKDVVKDGKTLRIIGLYQYQYQTPRVDGVPQDNIKHNIYYSQDQIDWLINLLDNTNSNTYVTILSHAVVCDSYDLVKNTFTPDYVFESSNPRSAMHTSTPNTYQSNPDMIVDIVDAWIKGVQVSLTNTMSADSSTITVNHTFASSHENQFMGFICGHTHADYIAEVPNKPYMKMVVLNCATSMGTQQSSDIYRTESKERDCFTSITFDWYNHTLRLIRWGADVTMFGQERKYGCVYLGSDSV